MFYSPAKALPGTLYQAELPRSHLNSVFQSRPPLNLGKSFQGLAVTEKEKNLKLKTENKTKNKKNNDLLKCDYKMRGKGVDKRKKEKASD